MVSKLRENPTFRRILDVLDHIQSINKKFEKEKAQKEMENALKNIQRAIHLEFNVSPDVAMILKDELLNKE